MTSVRFAKVARKNILVSLAGFELRGFCTSMKRSAFFESKVQTLFKKDSKSSISEFERNPTSFDATFLINQKSLPFETCLEVFDRVKKMKNIYPLVAIINSCSRNNRRSEMRQFLKELVTLLNGLDKAQQKALSEGIWNRVIVCLAYDELSEEEAIFWFLRFNDHQLGKPNIFAYTSILKVLSKRANFDRCFEVLDEMKKCGLEPNHITLQH